MSGQRAATFTSNEAMLMGILHEIPATVTRKNLGVVFLHGWSGYRVGPHQMFVHTARTLASDGIPSLRFDFRGRGDSEGDLDEANLMTMVEDVRAAVDFFVTAAHVDKVLLIGICSGAEVAFGAAMVHPAIAGLILWSAPIFWAEAAPEESHHSRIESRKRFHYLREYLGKLTRPATWKKLVTGKLQFGLIARVLLGRRKSSLDVQSPVTPQEFRKRTIQSFASFRGPILAVYGTNDPTTESALQWYQSLCREHSIPYEHHMVHGANHSYYSLQWEREVIEKSRQWIREISVTVK